MMQMPIPGLSRLTLTRFMAPLPVPTKTDAKYHGWLAAAANWEEIDNEIILELPQYTDYKDDDGITLTAVMEPLDHL